MNAPTISVLIPTAGRETLARCLDSVRPQLRMGDECLVIGDTHDGPMLDVASLVRRYGAGFRYLEHDAGHHCFGHCQLNAGLELARGQYVHANDDDDIYAQDALGSIRSAALSRVEPVPLLFRFQSYFGPVFWSERRVAENQIGGHCAVFPNLPGRLGRFTCRYAGDFDYIRSTLDRWPNGDEDAAWIDKIICVARPTPAQDWTRQ